MPSLPVAADGGCSALATWHTCTQLLQSRSTVHEPFVCPSHDDAMSEREDAWDAVHEALPAGVRPRQMPSSCRYAANTGAGDET